MGFKGLFIGTDRYQSNIPWLRCAKNDATALHALFTDSLGAGAALLTNEAATRKSVENHIKQLQSCDPDDVVVIAFSGHGTDTHELVMYDTDPRDLDGTTIPLATLSDWLSCIPARHLILFLDCCFSGGMGAKVFHSPLTPRGLRSTDDALKQLSGDGRLIFTACTATQEAWEYINLGHGLFTYHLLEALQGVDEVRLSGKISVYRLLEYIIQRVKDGAAKFGKVQEPTLRGVLDGEFTWPIFVAGSCYHAAFPQHVRLKISADVSSLASYGFPPQLIQAWAQTIPTLNSLQLEAINDYGILDGEHVVVSAPTSSGKTMIGELAALKGTLKRKSALFLLPLKALVSDKLRHFTKMYSTFGIQTIEATGETSDISPLIQGQYDICLMTYEKFAGVVLSFPHILNQVGTVVIDEVQMIADESRGANLEFVLTLLRMRRRQGIEPQVVALSAVIGDTNGLERWLDARLLRRDQRPVPLNEGVLRSDGTFRFIDAHTGQETVSAPLIQPEYRKGSSQDWLIPLVRRLVSEGKQVIVFRDIKPEARSCALYLAPELNLPPATEVLDKLPQTDPSVASNALHSTLHGGVAFHIADLSREERRVIEEEFRCSGTKLRVIVATTTLAMGVNTPAEAVVTVGLNHPGPNGSSQPYSIAEYKNMVGRAGRLGFSQEGYAYLLALNSRDEHYLWTRYILGKPEDIRSRFFHKDSDLRSLVIRILVAITPVSPQGIDAATVIDFLESSFGAFQQFQIYNQFRLNQHDILSALEELERYDLVSQSQSKLYQLTPLGRVAGEAVVEVETVIRLVECLRPLSPSSITDPTLITAAQITAELDQILFPLNKASTQKEPTIWRNELLGQGVPSQLLSRLDQWQTDQHQGTLRAKKAVACLLYITDRSMLDIEQMLTQFGRSRDGAAGAIFAVTSRTCDVLPMAFRIAEILHPGLELGERLDPLLTRLSLGLPAKVAVLATYTRLQLTRGDYLRLVEAALHDIDKLNLASDEDILPYLNGDGAKLAALRDAIKAYHARKSEQSPTLPILPPYES